MAAFTSVLLQTSSKTSRRFSLLAALGFAFTSNYSLAQDSSPSTDQDSTVTYPAAYFAEFEPFSVSDMLERIPGINVARGDDRGGGGPGSSRGSNHRGLGAGGDQVLINGRRIAGKENEGNNQLSRISASQVDHIEIIRGTSGDLDVRGGGQVINIVMLEAESSSSTAYELNLDHSWDGSVCLRRRLRWLNKCAPLRTSVVARYQLPMRR